MARIFKSRAEQLVQLALEKTDKSFMTYPSSKRQDECNSTDEEEGSYEPVTDEENDGGDDVLSRAELILSPAKEVRIIEHTGGVEEEEHVGRFAKPKL